MVSSYNVSLAPDANGNEVPMESFSLNFEEIKVTYTELDDCGGKKGNVEYSWKVEEGESLVAEPENDPSARVALIEAVRIAQ